MQGSGGSFVAGSIVGQLRLDKSQWTQSIGGVKQDLGQLKTSASPAAAAIGGLAGQFALGQLAAIGIQGALRFVVGQLGSCIKEAIAAEDSIAQLEAVLKSTKNASGMTKDELILLSEGLQDVTTYSDDTILAGENLLLTFTKIGKDIFPEATACMLDMSKALGQDLKGSAIQLGKALQDPILGITALRRVGVNFNDAQKDIIQKLVESGNLFEAQKLILKELSTEFGGSAQAAAGTYSGRLAQLKNSINDVKEEIGAALLPVLKKIVEAITPIVRSIGDWIKNNQDLIADTIRLVGDTADFVWNMGNAGSVLGLLNEKFADLKITLADIVAGPGGKLLLWIIETNHKMRDAERQTERLVDQQDKAKTILRDWARENEIGAATLNTLATAYDSNYVAMHNAIMEGKVGQGLQESLAEWHKKAAAAVNDNADATDALTETAKRLGFSLRTDVIAQIKELEGALELLRKKGEDTPGAINEINEKIRKLQTLLVDTNNPMVAMRLNLDDLTDRYTKYGASMPLAEQFKLRTEIVNTKLALEGATPSFETMVDKMMLQRETTVLVREETKSLGEEFGIVTKANIAATIDKITRALEEYKNVGATGETEKLEMRLIQLKLSAAGAYPPVALLEEEFRLWAKQGPPVRMGIVEIGQALGVTFSKDIENRIAMITQLFQDYGDQLPVGQQRAFREEMAQLKLGDMATEWFNFFDAVSQGAGNAVKECIKLPAEMRKWVDELPPLLGGLFTSIYDAFSQMVADMITKWVKDFLVSLVSETATAAGKATASLVGIGKTVMQTTGDVAGAAAKTATGAISGVATSLVNTISGVVTAVASVLNLFKKADYSSMTYWLKMIKDLNQEMRDYLFIVLEGQHLGYMHDIMVDDNKCLWDLVYKGQGILDLLGSGFQSVVDAIHGIKSMQGGGYVERGGLAMLHAGERVLSAPGHERPFQMATAAGSGQTVAITMNNTFEISGSASGDDVRKQVRGEIIPAILDSLDVHYMKALWQQKLGVK